MTQQLLIGVVALVTAGWAARNRFAEQIQRESPQFLQFYAAPMLYPVGCAHCRFAAFFAALPSVFGLSSADE
jgi:hypothetical protein